MTKEQLTLKLQLEEERFNKLFDQKLLLRTALSDLYEYFDRPLEHIDCTDHEYYQCEIGNSDLAGEFCTLHGAIVLAQQALEETK